METDGPFGGPCLFDRRYVAELVRRHTREDLAAAWQHSLETVIVRYVRHHMERLRVDRVTLAGAVAANVKMNQRIAEAPGVSRVFVYPSPLNTTQMVPSSFEIGCCPSASR